jgi:hypothetical protein
VELLQHHMQTHPVALASQVSDKEQSEHVKAAGRGRSQDRGFPA